MATVTVYNMTTQQKHSDVVTTGNTLGELKAALTANGINYNGMTFMEATTSTTLNNDNSTFPEGAKIFMTVSDKKISSGTMSRQELYAYIKVNNLGEQVKAACGKNYTITPTAELDAFVSTHKASMQTVPAATPDVTVAEAVAEAVASPCDCCVDKWLNEGMSNGYITPAQASWIKNGIKTSPINAADMEMFSRISK